MRSRRATTMDYWPGFVDAMAAALLTIILLLSVFVFMEFFRARELSGKDATLRTLRAQLSDLSSLLALEQRKKMSLQNTVSLLSQTLRAERQELDKQGPAGELRDALAREKEVSATALAQVEAVNQQLAALRSQLAALQEALEASEEKDRRSQAQIADLGKRLNTALAQKVQELSRHRSAFFASLSEALKDIEGVEVMGDRFILQSEILFSSGQATINPRGQWALRKVGKTLNNLQEAIPPGVPWVLRVDGHTDKVPIRNARFPSNWHLSVARSVAVVEVLVRLGVPPRHLVAAGFGEFRPIVPENSPEARRRNRRIEFKLTDR